MRQGIQWVLDNKSSYEVAKDLGINNRTINRYQNGTSEISKMTFETAEKLYNYYLEEMDKMKDINLIIEGLNQGAVQTNEEDPQYEDINGEEYVIHGVEIYDDMEVFYGKRDDANEIDPNDLDDIYDYDKVAAYRVDNYSIVWL